jgi:D-alanyl-D-alanine endopeptidase (penicillin-binding protein 7)
MRKILVTILSLFIFSTSQAAQPPSVLVYNLTTDTVVEQANANEVRPIASITKLMTAVVALDYYNLDQKIKINKQKTEQVNVLLTSLLVRSDNSAAEALAKSYPGGRSAFIAAMNGKARQLNLEHTKFIDPSGLGVFNLSTANELVDLLVHAYRYNFIRAVANQPEIYTVVKTKYGYKERPAYTSTSKNLLSEFDNIVLTKTGYTSRAGRCIILMVEKAGQMQAIVILGEPTKKHRDNLARQLIAQNS